MYRTDNATSSPTLPPAQPVGPNPNSYFTIGSPGTVASTVVDADFMNAVQEELCNVVTAAGITLSKTVRNQLNTAIGTLIAVETSRAEAAEALKAPIASPAFTGNGTIVGNFVSGGIVQAVTLQTSGAGNLNIGTGASDIGGSLTVGGAVTVLSLTTGGVIETTSGSGSAIYAPNGGVYAATLSTTAAGALHVGTGSSSFGGALTVAGAALFENTVYVDGQLTSASEINNPWFSSSAGGFLINQVLTVEAAVTCPEIITNGAYLPICANAYAAILNANGSAYAPLYCGAPGSQVQAATILNQFVGSLGTSGWQRIADNGSPTGYMLIQWSSTAGSALDQEIYFPMSFPNVCLAVVLSEGAAGSATWGAGNPTIHGSSGVSTVGFAHWTLTWNGSAWYNPGGIGNNCNYIAIGY